MAAQNVREALAWARQRLAGAGITNAKLDAELLLRHVLGWSRAEVLTRADQVLTADQQASFAGLIAQRETRKPVQYITGVQEFYGLEFAVSPAVLIPRPETELLVEIALRQLAPDASALVADVGTGSGAIAVTIAAHRPRAAVVATDLSPAALSIARANADRHSVADRVEFVLADLLPDDGQCFDLIASNPPYVPLGDAVEMQPEVRDYEPAVALYAGADGLDVYRRLVPLAASRLRPGGALVMEIGAGQREALAELLTGWRVEFFADLQGISRTVLACVAR